GRPVVDRARRRTARRLAQEDADRGGEQQAGHDREEERQTPAEPLAHRAADGVPRGSAERRACSVERDRAAAQVFGEEIADERERRREIAAFTEARERAEDEEREK